MISYINITDASIKSILADVKAQLKSKNCKSKKSIEIDFEVKNKDIQRPTVYIPLHIQRLIEEIVGQAADEVAWNCTVEYDPDAYTFSLKELLMFPQIVTSASVNVDDDKYIEFISNLSDDQLNTMRFHGHSHVNMGVFSSGTDDDYQRQMLTQIDDFYIFGIFNKRKEVTVYVYDVQKNLMFSGQDVLLRYDAVPENTARAEAKALLEANIIKPKVGYTQRIWDSRQNYNNNYQNRTEKPSALRSYTDYLMEGGYYD